MLGWNAVGNVVFIFFFFVVVVFLDVSCTFVWGIYLTVRIGETK